MKLNDDWQDVFIAVRNFIGIAAFMAILVGLIMLDAVVFANEVKENGATELAQATLLALNALIFARLAYLYPERRGCFVLIMGFFGCMLIRELDDLFDHIQHGFWKYPAWALTFVCIGYARLGAKGTVLSPLAALVRTPQFAALCYGMAIVMVFSRLYGNGAFWHAAMGEHFLRVAENVAEEGIELLGYGVLFGGCLGYYRRLRREQPV